MSSINRLLEVMAQLRDPTHGCPWDRQQSFESIAPYTIEEAYEVADAIRRGDMSDLAEELGDLLFQVVFHAQMASERDQFGFDDVVTAIVDKMIRRHPHVFSGAVMTDMEAQSEAWEAMKQVERRAQLSDSAPESALDGVPGSLPALMRASKLQRRAARAGFDWEDALAVLPKLLEEFREIGEVIEAQAPAERLAEEVGDLLFTCVNLARHLEVEPDSALQSASLKFETRFRRMEVLRRDTAVALDVADRDRLEMLWERAKDGEP